jgi:DNA processing protein
MPEENPRMSRRQRSSASQQSKGKSPSVAEIERMFDQPAPDLWGFTPGVRLASTPNETTSLTPTMRWARAANYASLVTVFGSEAKAEAAWRLLARLYDLNSPFNDDLLHFISRAGIPFQESRRVMHRFLAAQRLLNPDDMLLERGDPLYPTRLTESGDAPRFLYVRQSEGILDRPSLAIVGTRNPSHDGSRRARKLGALLAKAGVVVVSGLAKGIDTAAHVGCIEAGGQTVAVIGTPLNEQYPKENASLQELIGATGAVVSQFAPGSTTTRASFPIRNATMSGLALGTVVVEASETSGALIQARKALQQGRRLFIPRSAIENKALSWPEHYAKRGAIVFSDIDELVESLGLAPRASVARASENTSASLSV